MRYSCDVESSQLQALGCIILQLWVSALVVSLGRTPSPLLDCTLSHMFSFECLYSVVVLVSIHFVSPLYICSDYAEADVLAGLSESSHSSTRPKRSGKDTTMKKAIEQQLCDDDGNPRRPPKKLSPEQLEARRQRRAERHANRLNAAAVAADFVSDEDDGDYQSDTGESDESLSEDSLSEIEVVMTNEEVS